MLEIGVGHGFILRTNSLFLQKLKKNVNYLIVCPLFYSAKMITTFYPQKSDIFKMVNHLTDENLLLADSFQLMLILGTSGDIKLLCAFLLFWKILIIHRIYNNKMVAPAYI